MPDAGGARQVEYFAENCRDFGIKLFDILHPFQGIEHVAAPELGFILPGMVVAAGDSHTTTYGALGFGIGTSDIEHYSATQTLTYERMRTMRVLVDGTMGPGVTAKDIVMTLIRKIGAEGATGFVLEFARSAIAALTRSRRVWIFSLAAGVAGVAALLDGFFGLHLPFAF